MSDRSYGAAERRKALLDSFNEIKAYERRKKDAAEAIGDIVTATCDKLNITPKAYKAALRYWSLPQSEQRDIDDIMAMTQQAMLDLQPDLFTPDGYKVEIKTFQ